MADTIREQIISAYVTRLDQITNGNGYNSNVGNSVFRALKIIEQEDLPACVLWPGIEESVNRYGQNECVFTVKVEAIMEFGDTNPSVIQEQLLGDLIKCMTDPEVVVTALIESIEYIGGGPADQPEARETSTAVYAEFQIKYEFLVGNPYGQ